jgi:hypothetical protein
MPDTTDIAIDRARTALADARREIVAEIAGYPRPISGCDAQFNRLLEMRRQIGLALDALDAPVWVPTSRQPEPAGEAR